MKKNRKTTLMICLGLLLAAMTPPLTWVSASVDQVATSLGYTSDGSWAYMQNELITISFPADGKKPMFLWWYTKDPDNINVVKFKGLIEYCAYEKAYFLWKCQADAWRIRERIEAHYYLPKKHMLNNFLRLQALNILSKIGNATGLHAPYLSFSCCKWRLAGPENMTRDDVKYLGFNFTLVDVPDHRPGLQFAEGNIVIRCRFYYTSATEDVYGKYGYVVEPGELKIDIVIANWHWNIDKLEPIIDELRDRGFDVPEGKAGLALWVNLASINLEKIGVAKEDAESMQDAGLTESASMAKNMYVEGEKVSIAKNNTGNDETPLQNRLRERFRIRFERGNSTFAGFFKFVPQAIITDGVTYNTTEVTASYISAGNHLRLFIAYPYFNNYTLEHDPSIGVEIVAPWIPTNFLFLLIGATIVIGVAVAAVKMKKKSINIVRTQ